MTPIDLISTIKSSLPSNDGQTALGNQLRRSPLHSHPEVTAVRMSHTSSSHSMMSHPNMSQMSHSQITQQSMTHTQSETINIKQEMNCIEQDLDSDSLKIDE